MMRRIRLELARGAGHPDGSADHGYELAAPLTADGRLDLDAWPAVRDACRVRRFWGAEPERFGHLRHTRHRAWAFSYVPGEDDDEPLYRLDHHRLVPGDYVTVSEPGGEAHTFKVVSVS